MDEGIQLRDVCLSHPKVLEEVKRFKLPDDLTLVCDAWPYGRDSLDQHPRYVQVSFFIYLSSHGGLLQTSATCLREKSTQGRIIMISLFPSRPFLI